LKIALRIKRNTEKKFIKLTQRKQKKIQVFRKSTLNDNIINYTIMDNGSQNFILSLRNTMVKIIRDALLKFGSIKLNIIYIAKFIKNEKATDLPVGLPGNMTSTVNIIDINRIPEIIYENYEQNREVIDDMPLAESGSFFMKFSGVKLTFARNSAMAGSS